jgi:hypothetical protein
MDDTESLCKALLGKARGLFENGVLEQAIDWTQTVYRGVPPRRSGEAAINHAVRVALLGSRWTRDPIRVNSP